MAQLAHRPPPFSASNSRRTSSSETSANQPYAAATAASNASCASTGHCGRDALVRIRDAAFRPRERPRLCRRRAAGRRPRHRGLRVALRRFRRMLFQFEAPARADGRTTLAGRVMHGVETGGYWDQALPCPHITRSGQLQHAPVFQCGSRWLRWTFVRNRAT